MQYARTIPGGRVHHLVRADSTLCGLDVSAGFAVWGPEAMGTVQPAPVCKKCQRNREAEPAAPAAEAVAGPVFDEISAMLDAIAADKAAAEADAIVRATTCERCGKDLTGEDSVARGIGPVCAAGGRGGASRARLERRADKMGATVTVERRGDITVVTVQWAADGSAIVEGKARDAYGQALEILRGVASA